MKKLIISLFIFLVSCSSDKVSKNHGFRYLESKYEKITLNQTNKNDILKLIGPPSTISDFNTNKWFYIERRKTNQSLIKLGSEKIVKNNILIIEFNKNGLLKDKKLLNINDMNDVKYAEEITLKEFKQDNFIYNIFTSLREKINAPVKNRSKKK
jgi:Small protein A (tmRNA-binding)